MAIASSVRASSGWTSRAPAGRGSPFGKNGVLRLNRVTGPRARAMEPAAASKALLDAFLTRLPETARAAPEEWLETRGDAAPRDIAQLRLWRRRLQDGAPVPLDALHDLLTRLRSPPA